MCPFQPFKLILVCNHQAWQWWDQSSKCRLTLVGAGSGGSFANVNKLTVLNDKKSESRQSSMCSEDKCFKNIEVFTVLICNELPKNAKVMSTTWAKRERKWKLCRITVKILNASLKFQLCCPSLALIMKAQHGSRTRLPLQIYFGHLNESYSHLLEPQFIGKVASCWIF